MKLLFRTAILILFSAAISSETFGKEWKGIVPLRSTRADVERILGTPTSNIENSSYFSLRDELAVIVYQTESCNEGLGVFGFGWNVPLGIVISIGVIPKSELGKERFVDGDEFQTETGYAGFVHYFDETNGLTIETYKDKVSLLSYTPKNADESLRCPRVRECCFDHFPNFDEYSALSFEDEKARLDNYLIRLREGHLRGALIVYGENSAARRKLLKRAERAKGYLVKTRGLEAQRLLIVDGGYRDHSATQLHLYGIGGGFSRVILFPHIDPVAAAPSKRP